MKKGVRDVAEDITDVLMWAIEAREMGDEIEEANALLVLNALDMVYPLEMIRTIAALRGELDAE